jgi:hypothetical protein
MRNMVVKKFGGLGIAFLVASLLPNVAASESTVVRDCDGYPVADTAEVLRDMQERLDTISSSALQDIYIGFWTVQSHPVPDSCRVVFCPGVYDTLPQHYYKTWSHRLFTDHELFDRFDTLHPVVPGQLEIMPDYNGLLARKSTILALYKECYVRALAPGFVLVPVQKPNAKLPSTKTPVHRFDALGRTPESRSKPLKLRLSPPTYLLR